MPLHRFLLASTAIALIGMGEPIQETDAPTAVPAARRAERVAVFPIHGEIDSVTMRSLERRLERARADGIDAVVIELDTPGGEVGAALDICRLIKSDMPANTVAWVRPTAYSAGTIIALAAREIIVTPDAVFGDSAPIAAVPGVGLVELPPAERAKAESPLLSEVIDSARRNHWDERLVQAFIAVGVELWMLEDVRSGERVFVDRAEYLSIFGTDPPEQITSASPTGAMATRAPVRPFFSELFGVPPRGRRHADLSPDAQRAQIEFEQALPSSRPRLDSTERPRWRLVTQVDTSDRLLTVRSGEALGFGLAVATIADDEGLRQFFGGAEIRRYNESWSEGLVRFLMSWPVRMLLVAVMVICFLIELAVPGFGVFGITSLVCLAVLIGAPALAGLAQWWQLALVGIGITLVVIELLAFPGTIVIGFVGAVSVLIGVAGSFVQSELTSPAGQRELLLAIGATIGVATLASLIGGTVLRKLGGPWLLRRAILSAEVGGGAAALSVDSGRIDASDDGSTGASLAATAASSARDPLVRGTRGVAFTDLRPTGKGEFQGKLYDVRCIEGYLERGRPIRVVRSGPAEFEVESDTA